MNEAIGLLEQGREAVLATLEGEQPFTSAVGYLYELPADGIRFGKVLILMSELARHTKNTRRHSCASLMVLEEGDAPVYERKRVAVQGVLEQVQDPKQFEAYKKAYQTRYPSSQIFFTLSDFHFFELKIEELYYVGGFGKIQTFK